MSPKPTILIVDDDPHYRAALQAALYAHYRVRVTDSLSGMVEMLAAYVNPPALIILDWFYEHADAYAALTWMRFGAYHTVPVLIVTASSTIEQIRTRLADLGVLVLPKTISFNDLQTFIARLVQPDSQRVSLASLFEISGNSVTRVEAPFPTVELPPAQLALFQILLEYTEPVSAATLASRLVVYHADVVKDRVIVKRIHALRPQVEPLGITIGNRRGMGYYIQLTPLCRVP
ncbi:MAG: response regulator [Chloroflexi bacterium]|nr:response regulator [Chloroflexota bacterium]MBU1747159.1 response regulator [Chloroflexota bacterium]